MSGTSVFPVLHPALLPASAHRHCLPCPQMNSPQSHLRRSAPPLGCWIPAPLNDFVLVITLSSLYQVRSRCLIAPISIQTCYNISRLKKQTNPPLILYPFRTCLFLCSLSHKKPQRLSALHMSLLRQLQSPRLYLPKGLSSSPHQLPCYQAPGPCSPSSTLSSICHSWSPYRCNAIFFWLW